MTRMALRTPMRIEDVTELDHIGLPILAVEASGGVRVFSYDGKLFSADYISRPRIYDFNGIGYTLPDGIDAYLLDGTLHVYDYADALTGTRPYLERLLAARNELGRFPKTFRIHVPTLIKHWDGLYGTFKEGTTVFLRDIDAPYIQPVPHKRQKRHGAWLRYKIPELFTGTLLEVVDGKLIVVVPDGNHLVVNIREEVDNYYLNKYQQYLEGQQVRFYKQGEMHYYKGCNQLEKIINGTV